MKEITYFLRGLIALLIALFAVVLLKLFGVPESSWVYGVVPVGFLVCLLCWVVAAFYSMRK